MCLLHENRGFTSIFIMILAVGLLIHSAPATEYNLDDIFTYYDYNPSQPLNSIEQIIESTFFHDLYAVDRQSGHLFPQTFCPSQQRLIAGRLGIPAFAMVGDYHLSVNVEPSQEVIRDASSFGFAITCCGERTTGLDDWSFPMRDGFASSFGEALAARPEPGPAGVSVHQIRWNDSGLTCGVYFFRLDASGKALVQRGLLARWVLLPKSPLYRHSMGKDDLACLRGTGGISGGFASCQLIR